MSAPKLTETEAANEIHAVLNNFGHNVNVNSDEVAVKDDKVILGIRSCKLADQIWDLMFPRAESGVYYHFTKMPAFQSIISSERLRLYNLHKRYNDDEFRTFCRDHGLKGFLDESNISKQGDLHQTLMDDLFYVSFVADPEKDSMRHWELFGGGHSGVRLGFMVDADNYTDFRSISYQAPDRLPIFFAMQKAFAARQLRFYIQGVSRMGTYYVLKQFQSEAEQRLVIKKPPGKEPFEFKVTPGGPDRVKYIECEMAGKTCSKFNLRLVEITPGRAAKRDVVDAAVRCSQSYSQIPITNP